MSVAGTPPRRCGGLRNNSGNPRRRLGIVLVLSKLESVDRQLGGRAGRVAAERRARRVANATIVEPCYLNVAFDCNLRFILCKVWFRYESANRSRI